ncbi:expressed unknown protein [Seminavis robusta]|uniref:Uncharacterized protein n=1 Tax=Seminavis robusta TaxID=568900 RepID=A0A9N8D9Y8_9STRA|nr:expressed unknown protein [Seminavis robusta]|eukprot:Sro46_g027410.1 n/a (530) ;mRNA; r:60155-61744
MNDSGYEQYYGDEGEDEFYEETAAVAPRGGTAGPRRSVPEVIHGQVRVPPPTALQTAKLQEDHNHDLLNNKDGQHQQQATSSNAIPTTMSVNYLGNPQGNISTNRSSPTPITPSSSSSSSSTCRDQDIISPSLVTDNEDVQDEDSEADRNPRDITSSGIPNPDSRPVPMTPQTNSYYASTSANTNTNTNTYQGSQQQNAPSSTIATTNPYNHMYGYGHHHHNPTANSNFLAAPANPFSRQQHNDQIMEEEEGQDSFSSIQQQHLPIYFNNHSTSLGSTPAATAAHAFDDSLRANDPLDSISTHGERTVDSTTASTASLLESNQGYNQNYHNVNNINNSNNHSYQHQETYSHNNTLLVDQSGWNYQTQQQQQQQQQQYSQTISDTRYGGHYHQEATSYETSEPQARPGYPADHNYNQQQQYHNSSQNPRQHEEGNWRQQQHQQQQQQQPAASTRPRLPSTGDTCHPADVTRPAISYSGRDDALMSDRSQPANVTRPSYLSGNDVAMSDRSQPAHVTRPAIMRLTPEMRLP